MHLFTLASKATSLALLIFSPHVLAQGSDAAKCVHPDLLSRDNTLLIRPQVET